MPDLRWRGRIGIALLSAMAAAVSAQAADDPGNAPRSAKGSGRQDSRPAEPATPPAKPAPRPSPFRDAAAARPRMVIPAGMEVSVRLAETLDTKHVHTGDRFSAVLDAPITVGNHVVVPRGTVFEGHVTEATTSGRLRGRGSLGLALDSFRLQGTTYRVVTAAEVRKSGDHKKRNAALIGGGTGIGAALGAISGVGAAIGAGAGAAAGTTTALITGKRNVKLEVETPLVFSLSRNVNVRV